MDDQKARLYTTVIIALPVIACIIGYFIFFVFRQHKRLLQLQVQNAGAEVAALEKDRARIATDLHDELAPMLVSVRMLINSLQLQEEKEKELLSKTNSTIDAMAKRMRAISFDLMPAALISNGLAEALEEFIEKLSHRSDLRIRFHGSPTPLVLGEQQSIHLYRVLLEIINNTLKHAEATELVIDIQRQKNYILIYTRDNGRGFNYDEQLQKNNGLGLRSLLNRISLLEGEFSIKSAPGEGTVITIEIPQ